MNGLDTDALTALLSKANTADPQLAMMFSMLNRLDDNITKLSDRIETQNEARRLKESEQDSKIINHEGRLSALESGTRDGKEDFYKRSGLTISIVGTLIAIGAFLMSLFHIH